MIKVTKVSAPADLDHVHAIRKKVFVEEQNCPPELEWANEDISVHFLAKEDEVPCGAARWRKTENGYKLERFAVQKEFRGRGVGAAMVKAVLADLPTNAPKIYLNAQLPAVNFYRNLGFIPEGDEFEEAGILHRQMVYTRGD